MKWRKNNIFIDIFYESVHIKTPVYRAVLGSRVRKIDSFKSVTKVRFDMKTIIFLLRDSKSLTLIFSARSSNPSDFQRK